jgi:amino acid transporter
MGKKIILIILFIVNALIININFAQAEDTPTLFQNGLNKTAQGTGHKTGEEVPASIDTRIGTIIQIALSFLGVVFLLLMIYGGYLWMMAQGNDEQVEKAKNLITAAIIGLVIVISAYAISYFVIKGLSDEVLLE